MRGLGDRIVFVTGGARGIGRAISERLASEGARVAIADIDLAGARSTAAEIGKGALGVALDVTDDVSVRAAVGAAMAHFGRIDALVNNAGGQFAAPLESISARPESESRSARSVMSGASARSLTWLSSFCQSTSST